VVAQVAIPPGGQITVWASGKDCSPPGLVSRRSICNELHTDFKLDADGGYIALLNLNDTALKASEYEYTQQYDDVPYGRPLGMSQPTYLDTVRTLSP
jgi:hypothetical protein